MTTPPPQEPTSVARRGVRALAIAVVASIVVAVGAVTGDNRTAVLAVTTAVLAVVAALHWRSGGRRSSIGTSAAVAAVLVGLLVVEDRVTDIDTVLATSAVVSLTSAVVLRERRLAITGLLSWGVLLGRPLADGDAYRHCLLATNVELVPPRLDGPLLLAVGALAVGTLVRWYGPPAQRTTARGAEAVGLIGLTALLLAKAVELPGHRLMCGAGDPLDEGWLVLAVLVGVVAVVYGLATRDLVWSGAGLAGVALPGLVGTLLTSSPAWVLGTGAMLAIGLVVAERAGVAWPDDGGYAVARPGRADWLALLERARQHVPPPDDPSEHPIDEQATP